MHMGWIGAAHFRQLKPKVIIAVRQLRGTSRIHKVYLRSHLIIRAKPRLGHRRNRRIGKIPQEYIGCGKTQLFQ